MGIRLVTWVLDHAPTDLSMAERLVLLVIAEEANDDTRKGWPPVEVIADRSGLEIESVRSVIKRLRARGYDIRVPLKVGRDGRPVYSWPGRSVTYSVPVFPERGGPGARRRAERRSGRHGHSVRKAGSPDQEGGVLRPERRSGHTAPSPQSLLSSSPQREGADVDTSSPAPRLRTAGALSHDWEPNQEHRKLAVELKKDVDHIAAKFRSYHQGEGTRKTNWDADFMLWLRREDPERDPGAAAKPEPNPCPCCERAESGSLLDLCPPCKSAHDASVACDHRTVVPL